MNKKQRQKVYDLVEAARARFIEVGDLNSGYGAMNSRRVEEWMRMMEEACVVINDAVSHPRPPKFSRVQVALMASGFMYLFDARNTINRHVPIKDAAVSDYILRVWGLHLPFLDRFRGRGHPDEAEKLRLGIT